MNILIANGNIVRRHHIETGDLWYSNGKIIPQQKQADIVIDAGGMYVAPGYIDLQINGAHGFDFTSNPESIENVAAILPNYGVTGFLPTIISATPERYREILRGLQPGNGSTHGAINLGIHLEGPFLNPLFAGAHRAEYFLQFQGKDPLMDCYGSLEGVKMITLAPELTQALQWIENLRRRGIVVTAGHTSCTLKEIEKGFASGVSMITHLFNAMEPFHHRSPGLIGAVLSNPDRFYSIIADGVHVHPAALKMAWQANSEGLVLISDAVSAMGAGEGIHRLGDVRISASNGHAVLECTTTLAGSVLTLDAAVRNMRTFTGCSVAEAINAATFNAARILGIEHQKGSLDIGCDADIIILDEKLNVKKTFIAGIEARGRMKDEG